MARVPTGIKGFDRLVQGGFPKYSSVLVVGSPGTGKSIFAMSFLYTGAKKGENSLFITFEQREFEVLEHMKSVGMDLKPLIKKGLLEIWPIHVKDLKSDITEKIKEKVRKKKIKRLAIDSITTLFINAPVYLAMEKITLQDALGESTVFTPPVIGDFIVKKFIYFFIDALKEMKCTTILVSDTVEEGKHPSRDGISEFLADGLIHIIFEAAAGQYTRNLVVRKMRATNNDEKLHRLDITSRGLIVHSS